MEDSIVVNTSEKGSPDAVINCYSRDDLRSLDKDENKYRAHLLIQNIKEMARSNGVNTDELEIEVVINTVNKGSEGLSITAKNLPMEQKLDVLVEDEIFKDIIGNLTTISPQSIVFAEIRRPSGGRAFEFDGGRVFEKGELEPSDHSIRFYIPLQGSKNNTPRTTMTRFSSAFEGLVVSDLDFSFRRNPTTNPGEGNTIVDADMNRAKYSNSDSYGPALKEYVNVYFEHETDWFYFISSPNNFKVETPSVTYEEKMLNSDPLTHVDLPWTFSFGEYYLRLKSGFQDHLPEDVESPSIDGVDLENFEQTASHISELVEESYREHIRSLILSCRNLSEYRELSENETEILDRAMVGFDICDFGENPRDDIDNMACLILDEFFSKGEQPDIQKLRFWTVMLGKFSVALGKSSSPSSKRQRRRTQLTTVCNETDSEPYAAVNINDERAKALYQRNGNIPIISLPSSEWYDILSEVGIDYKRLSKVDPLNENPQINTFSRTRTKNADNTMIVWFGNTANTKKHEISMENLRDELCGELEIGPYSAQYLVCFRRGGEYTLGEYKNKVATEDTPAVSVTKEEWEELEEFDRALLVEEYFEQSSGVPFTTTNGRTTLSETSDPLLFHVLDEEYSNFSDNDTIKNLTSYFSRDDTLPNRLSSEEIGNILYVPIRREKFALLKTALEEGSHYVISNEDTYNVTDYGTVLTGPTDPELYVAGKLPEFHGERILDVLSAGISKKRETIDSLNALDSMIEEIHPQSSV